MTKHPMIGREYTGGYIKISRKLLQSEGWTAETLGFYPSWIDMIGLAEYEDRKKVLIRGRVIDLRRGDVAWSTLGLSRRWGVAEATAASRLRLWLGAEWVSERVDSGLKLWSIVNYDVYQDGGKTATNKRRSNKAGPKATSDDVPF